MNPARVHHGQLRDTDRQRNACRFRRGCGWQWKRLCLVYLGGECLGLAYIEDPARLQLRELRYANLGCL